MGDKAMRREIRRTMMFLNCQKASLVKDPYVYEPDCVILDLEDAVAASEKDSARFQLYNTLKYLDYRTTESWVRINGVDTPHYKEDIRAAVAGHADGIRIPVCESAEDVKLVEQLVSEAEQEFGVEAGQTMLMAALESPKGVMHAYDIATASQRMMGIALSAGDFTRTMHAKHTKTGEELFLARGMIVMAARAANVMCFDTVHTDLDDLDSLKKETELIANMGFDGKSVINPKQIKVIHNVFNPSAKEISHSEHILIALNENKANGIGVMVVDGKMIDIAMKEGAERTLKLAKATGLYKGDLV